MTIEVQHNIGDEVIYSSEGRRGAKKAYAAHRSTKALCDLFLANDRILQQKRSAPSEAPLLMTYQEVLREFDKIGGNMNDYFEQVPQPNGKKPLWRWKS